MKCIQLIYIYVQHGTLFNRQIKLLNGMAHKVNPDIFKNTTNGIKSNKEKKEK